MKRQPVAAVEDKFDRLFRNFVAQREVDLHHRFNGWYRSLVVETNDPLGIRRVRVRIPELHDIDVQVRDLPWAVPAPWMGGQNAGSHAYAAIDDIVFVCFEKNHPYAPVYCASADPTRRQMYSLWSIYANTPVAVNENGDVDEKPSDDQGIEEYLPKDGRPMSMSISDRYGNFLNFNAHGFAPKSHKISPEPVGVDALSSQQFSIASATPTDNDPDTKYIAMGTKYGHTILMGDQGYKWYEDFEGDYNSDEQFEIDRFHYMLKSFNEQEAKERDQRRIEMRTRAGHQFEMRDVGWDMSREGEYGERKSIGDSQDRDERWVKLKTKGGHLIQALDKGFDPLNDNFYNRLTNSEFGVIDHEDELGDDSRMIRLITRHGNMLILDDRGSSPTNAEEESPHGNGVMVRTRGGHQIQMVDKPEQNHIMIASGGDQVIEINDLHQYVVISTNQTGGLHEPLSTENIRRAPPYINQTGRTNDPEANTCHMVLDNLNTYVRMRTPDGAGIEARGGGAPCATWTEINDNENRGVWMSQTDQLLVIRGKNSLKYIAIDDNDDAILIRNEVDRIQIRALGNIEIKSDNGNICFDASNGEIGFKAKKIAAQTEGTSYVFDGVGFGSTRKVQAQILEPIPRGETPCSVDDKDIDRRSPLPFDKERGCDATKAAKGPLPPEVTSGGSGGGAGGPGSGGGGGLINPPDLVERDPSPFAPTELGANPPPTPDPVPNPIPTSGGVLWYGVSSIFKDSIMASGLSLSSFANHENIPPDTDATEFKLSRNIDVAKGTKQAILSQKRYGGTAVIIRIRSIPDGDLLSIDPNDSDFYIYSDDIPFEGNLEIYDVGNVELTQPPLFPNVS